MLNLEARCLVEERLQGHGASSMVSEIQSNCTSESKHNQQTIAGSEHLITAGEETKIHVSFLSDEDERSWKASVGVKTVGF